MNKTLVGLLVALVLAVGALLVLRERADPDPYAKFPERDFAIRDTARVHRLFIADRQGRAMTFVRQPNGSWLINDSVRASPTIMESMLVTLQQLTIDYVPPEATQRTALADMRANALKVEAFDASGERLKSLLLGTATPGTRSTFALIEGFDKPFAVRRGMMTGSIRNLFDLRSVDAFRDKVFVAYDPTEITSVEARYGTTPSESFRIARDGDSLKLAPLVELAGRPARAPVQRRLESYLEGFASVPLFYRATEFPSRDSITALRPHLQLVVELAGGQRDTLEVVPQLNRNARGVPDPAVAFSNYWVERGRDEFVVVQDQQLAPLMKSYSSFFP